jgi:hypothetical protein
VTGWTAADQAELDVLLWALADGYHKHRTRCRACQPDPPPGIPHPCPSVLAAIREVCDWLEARRLLSCAEALRADLEKRAA